MVNLILLQFSLLGILAVLYSFLIGKVWPGLAGILTLALPVLILKMILSDNPDPSSLLIGFYFIASVWFIAISIYAYLFFALERSRTTATPQV
jgi:hypothetical protein